MEIICIVVTINEDFKGDHKELRKRERTKASLTILCPGYNKMGSGMEKPGKE